MSGGHFDLSDYSLRNFAEELTLEINNNSVPNSHGDTRNYSEETLARLKQIAAMAQALGPMVKAADYLYDGDHSEDSFNKIVDQAMPHIDIILGMSAGELTSVWCDRPAVVMVRDHEQMVTKGVGKKMIRVS